MRAAQARISELQSQLEKLGGKGVGAGDPTAVSSQALYPSIRELPLLGRRTVGEHVALLDALAQAHDRTLVDRRVLVRSPVLLQAIAVVLVSHRMPDVFAVADRVLVLRRGRKVAEKPVAESSPEEVTGLITGAIDAA